MIDKKLLNGILALISVLVLIIPIGVAGYIAEQKLENIIAVQGLYPSGVGFSTCECNVSNTFTGYGNWEPSVYEGWDSNNDTAFIGKSRNGGIYTGAYYGNYMSYMGNSTYVANVNFSHIPISEYDNIRYLLIPLNVSTSDLLDYDFMRIRTDIDDSDNSRQTIFYQATDNQLYQLTTTIIDNETGIVIPSAYSREYFKSYPNGTVYLGFTLYEDSAESTPTFTWSVNGITLDESDQLFSGEYTDITIWIAYMLVIDGIYLFVVVFANPYIDIKWDSKKSKWRK